MTAFELTGDPTRRTNISRVFVRPLLAWAPVLAILLAVPVIHAAITDNLPSLLGKTEAQFRRDHGLVLRPLFIHSPVPPTVDIEPLREALGSREQQGVGPMRVVEASPELYRQDVWIMRYGFSGQDPDVLVIQPMIEGAKPFLLWK